MSEFYDKSLEILKNRDTYLSPSVAADVTRQLQKSDTSENNPLYVDELEAIFDEIPFDVLTLGDRIFLAALRIHQQLDEISWYSYKLEWLVVTDYQPKDVSEMSHEEYLDAQDGLADEEVVELLGRELRFREMVAASIINHAEVFEAEVDFFDNSGTGTVTFAELASRQPFLSTAFFELLRLTQAYTLDFHSFEERSQRKRALKLSPA